MSAPPTTPSVSYVVRTEELEPLPDYEPQRDINYMIRLTLMNHENEQRAAVLD